jgi:hypothetical protein
VPRPGRNQPCPCGSGRKVKRCCGEQRGPSNDQLARAYIAQRAGAAASELSHVDEHTLRQLWDDIVELPELDLSLALTLPTLITPELDQLFQAVIDDDPDRADELIPSVLAQTDTPQERARLARSILALRDSKQLPAQQAAIALVDLGTPSDMLTRASLIQAIFVKTGQTHTPAAYDSPPDPTHFIRASRWRFPPPADRRRDHASTASKRTTPSCSCSRTRPSLSSRSTWPSTSERVRYAWVTAMSRHSSWAISWAV